ncbi:DnaD domain protein [Bacillus mycoides]|uniref:DnaD and phage-associated domain-containing protein n=1 Tax=Bacillus cereus VD021 TaxID=1053224 RepID=R8GY56_BACCE|nr:DnaD domain protein [Bacillus cereus]EOO65511.1 DnaD and phage-associated domain-containing protein [Bacillus cereus VD021]
MSNSNTSNNIHQILFDETPLLVRPALARKLNDSDMALIVQQVHYWITTKQQLSDDRTFKNGHMWVYNSISKWQEQFTWIPRKTLTRKFTKLREKGVLVADTLNKMKEDRTLWYRIDYEVLLSLPEKNYYEIECEKDAEKKEKKKNEHSEKKSESKSKTEKKEPLGHNVQMYNNNSSNEEEATKPQSDTLGQNGVMHLDKMSQPIPENSLPKNLLSLFSKYVSIDMSPIDFFKESISSKPTKYVQIELEALTKQYGKDIVNESIKRLADLNTNKYIATIKGIISRWEKQGMKSFEDIERVESAYVDNKKQQQQQKTTLAKKTNNPKRTEMVPEWVPEERAAQESAASVDQTREIGQKDIDQLKEFLLHEAKQLQKEINVSELTLENFNTLGVYTKMGFTLQEAAKILKESPLMNP